MDHIMLTPGKVEVKVKVIYFKPRAPRVYIYRVRGPSTREKNNNLLKGKWLTVSSETSIKSIIWANIG